MRRKRKGEKEGEKEGDKEEGIFPWDHFTLHLSICHNPNWAWGVFSQARMEPLEHCKSCSQRREHGNRILRPYGPTGIKSNDDDDDNDSR